MRKLSLAIMLLLNSSSGQTVTVAPVAAPATNATIIPTASVAPSAPVAAFA
jgi:hypothetical protein